MAFCGTQSIGTPELVFAAQWLAYAHSLSTLYARPRDLPRMTRSPCGSRYAFTVEDFHLLPPGLPAHAPPDQ